MQHISVAAQPPTQCPVGTFGCPAGVTDRPVVTKSGYLWTDAKFACDVYRYPYLLMGLKVHSNLLRLIRDGGGGSGGMGAYVLPPTHYTVTARMTLH